MGRSKVLMNLHPPGLFLLCLISGPTCKPGPSSFPSISMVLFGVIVGQIWGKKQRDLN